MNVDGLTYAEIVALAYALEDQAATEDAYRLFGTVTSIDTEWSEDYQNITVTIAVAGCEEQPIQCYRLKGEGAKDLKVGDAITVEGILKNYKGTYEFDAGCVLVGYGEHVDQKALLKAAFSLADGASLDYPAVVTGVITEIPSAWSDEYGNITVNMEFDGNILQCYRLSGEGAKDLAVGDTITVAGMIKNYKGLIEFDKGCKLVPNDAYHSVKNALSGYKLLDGEAQTAAKTITGTISAVDTAWSEDYQNITVTIVVAGLEDYPIMCYRLKGEGAKDLAVGDTITVTGILKNYKGTIEFDAGCTLG
jgi:DNA/RNA endonuclease YhcR with UshA esterase domain